MTQMTNHHPKQQQDSRLTLLVRSLGMISAFGFVYSAFALLTGIGGIQPDEATVYLIWFAISMLATQAMLNEAVFGAYALVIATVGITVYEIARGAASIGGATLGGLVLLLAWMYIRTADTR